MKRYLKYGLIIISVFAVIGLVFYMLKRPKESIILNIPADVSYCFTINKQQFSKENLSETFQTDSFLQKIKARLPAKAIKVFNVANTRESLCLISIKIPRSAVTGTSKYPKNLKY